MQEHSSSSASILKKRNLPQNLAAYRAFSYLYLIAKRYAAIQIVLTVAIPVVLTAISVLKPGFKLWSSFYGITLSFLDTALLDKMQKDSKKEAAKIQELYDCSVIDLEWNEFKVGDKPTGERIRKAQETYKSKPLSSRYENDFTWIANNFTLLPLHLGRILWQRYSIVQDLEVRSGYAAKLRNLTISVCLIALIATVARKMNMQDLILTILAPISPAILWAVREVLKQRDATFTLDKLRKHTQNLFDSALKHEIPVEEMNKKSREIQDELFSHRATSPNVIARLSKKHFERANAVIREMTSEALRHQD